MKKQLRHELVRRSQNAKTLRAGGGAPWVPRLTLSDALLFILGVIEGGRGVAAVVLEGDLITAPGSTEADRALLIPTEEVEDAVASSGGRREA